MRRCVLLLVVCSLFLASGCVAPKDPVLTSLGTYSTGKLYTSGEFQDYTDYAKYAFDHVDVLNSPYFLQIDPAGEKRLIAHIANFEGWVKTIAARDPMDEVVVHYDFDTSIISEDDYLYIYDDPDYQQFGNYDVYFLDMETLVLYYFHNNI